VTKIRARLIPYEQSGDPGRGRDDVCARGRSRQTYRQRYRTPYQRGEAIRRLEERLRRIEQYADTLS